MRVENKYDLIIVGDQLSGYFLAAAAVQAGFKVLVVEGSASPTAIYEVPSGNFLTDIHWEPLFGLSEGGAVDVFLKSLGLYSNVDELFPQFDPPLQLLMPKQRLDYRYNAKDLSREWRREFPQLGEPLARLAHESFKTNFKAENQPFASLVEKMGLPVTFEKLGAVQIALYSALMPKELYCSAYRLSSQRGSAGVRYVLGGKSSLKERLIGRLQVFGGAIKRGAWAEEIVFDKGQLSGVLLSSFEGFVRARQVVGAMDAHRFLNLVPKAYRPKAVSTAVESLRPKYWRFSFCVHLPEELVPEGMNQHVAYFDPDADLLEENFLQICAFAKGVYSGIPMGKRALLVRVLVPFHERSLDPRYLSGVIKRSLKHMREFIPFLDPSTVQVSPDPQNMAEDPVFKRSFKFSGLDKIPANLFVYDSIHDRFCERGVSMDWRLHGVPGLGLCSRDVNPLYGVYGEILAAKEFLDSMIAERALRTNRPQAIARL